MNSTTTLTVLRQIASCLLVLNCSVQCSIDRILSQNLRCRGTLPSVVVIIYVPTCWQGREKTQRPRCWRQGGGICRRTITVCGGFYLSFAPVGTTLVANGASVLLLPVALSHLRAVSYGIPENTGVRYACG